MTEFPPRPDRHQPTDDALALLAAGVPLSLLLDLVLPLDAGRLLRDERADTAWVPSAVA